MRLLDLFSGAGGAAMGYHRAGFDEIVGVDLAPQKRYPFTFVQGDALEYVREHGHEFDVIHASPPCQAYSVLRHAHQDRDYPDLVDATRQALIATGRPYVIENVVGAPLNNPVVLCGTMFGLGTDEAELWRHRLFETTFYALTPGCQHRVKPRVIGVYGGHGRDRRRLTRPQDFSTEERRIAMGIDWMTCAELSQAIPPAYTQWIGERMLESMEVPV